MNVTAEENGRSSPNDEDCALCESDEEEQIAAEAISVESGADSGGIHVPEETSTAQWQWNDEWKRYVIGEGLKQVVYDPFARQYFRWNPEASAWQRVEAEPTARTEGEGMGSATKSKHCSKAEPTAAQTELEDRDSELEEGEVSTDCSSDEEERDASSTEWWWCNEYRRYVHTKSQTIYDPFAKNYLRWESDTCCWIATDGPPQENSSCSEMQIQQVGVDRALAGGENDSDLEDGELPDDSGALEEGDGVPEPDAVVSEDGNWIFDGEFWINADGVSYHPGLGQYFSNGQRIFMNESQPAQPDEGALYRRWMETRYVLDYPQTTETNAGSNDTEKKSRESNVVVGKEGGSLGRSKSCSVHIPRTLVSRQHAEITWDHTLAGFFVKDLGSTRGTFLNGRRLGVKRSKRCLEIGDILLLGPVVQIKVLQVNHEEEQATLHLAIREQKSQQGRRHAAAPFADCQEAADSAGPEHKQQDRDTHIASYRDRAAERRGRHENAEKAEVVAAYAMRVKKLERNRAMQDTEAAPVVGGKRSLAQQIPEQIPEWLQRGGKLLKKMGWIEGQGLGRESQGITDPIAPAANESRHGLGRPNGTVQGASGHLPKSGVQRMIQLSNLRGNPT